MPFRNQPITAPMPILPLSPTPEGPAEPGERVRMGDEGSGIMRGKESDCKTITVEGRRFIMKLAHAWRIFL